MSKKQKAKVASELKAKNSSDGSTQEYSASNISGTNIITNYPSSSASSTSSTSSSSSSSSPPQLVVYPSQTTNTTPIPPQVSQHSSLHHTQQYYTNLPAQDYSSSSSATPSSSSSSSSNDYSTQQQYQPQAYYKQEPNIQYIKQESNIPNQYTYDLANMAKQIYDAHSRTFLQYFDFNEMNRLLQTETCSSNEIQRILQTPKAQVYIELAEKLTVCVQSIIDFSKMVPGFMQLIQDDQINLLKSASYGIMLLYAAQCYVPERNAFVYNQQLINIDSFMASLSKANVPLKLDDEEIYFIQENLDFIRQLKQFNLSNTELALLSAIILFQPDNMSLTDSKTIYHQSQRFVELLRMDIENSSKKSSLEKQQFIQQLLNLVQVNLRHLNNSHYELIKNFKIKNPHVEFPALHRELFNTDYYIYYNYQMQQQQQMQMQQMNHPQQQQQVQQQMPMIQNVNARFSNPSPSSSCSSSSASSSNQPASPTGAQNVQNTQAYYYTPNKNTNGSHYYSSPTSTSSSSSSSSSSNPFLTQNSLDFVQSLDEVIMPVMQTQQQQQVQTQQSPPSYTSLSTHAYSIKTEQLYSNPMSSLVGIE